MVRRYFLFLILYCLLTGAGTASASPVTYSVSGTFTSGALSGANYKWDCQIDSDATPISTSGDPGYGVAYFSLDAISLTISNSAHSNGVYSLVGPNAGQVGLFENSDDDSAYFFEIITADLSVPSFGSLGALFAFNIPESVVDQGSDFPSSFSLFPVNSMDVLSVIRSFYTTAHDLLSTVPQISTSVPAPMPGDTGSLEVAIAPDDAVDAGAQWQVDGGAWNDSGTELFSLPAGAHTVTFSHIDGWTRPASQTVTVSWRQLATTSGTYGPEIFATEISNDQITITGYNGPGGDVIIPGTLEGLPVTGIGDYAFASGTSLTSVTISGSVTSIGGYAFANCTGLTRVTIPGSVTTLGTYAFEFCTSLTSVTLLDGVTQIGQGAFGDCTSLTSVTIPGSVTTIADGAFGGCTSLARVTIPGSVTAIGDGAFAECASLTSVTIPGSVTAIGDGAFTECTGLTSVTIPGSVTSIGDGAFYDCASLASVTLPGSVNTIGTYAFYGCASLTSVIIPGNVTTVGEGVFGECASLTSVTLLNGVVQIGGFAFSGCQSLTSVIIPGSVTTIGEYAFFSDGHLKSAVFAGNAPTMGWRVFDNAADGFSVYFFHGATGFTSPTWNDGQNVYPSSETGAVALWLLSYGFDCDADMQSEPNHDGVSLLMAYALNLDPSRNQGDRVPHPSISGNQMSLAFYAGSPGITYCVETSTDLTTWHSDTATLSAPDSNQVVTATIPMTGLRCFMRLKVW